MSACVTRVVRPVRFTPSMLTSTNASNAEAFWSAGAYDLGDVVLQNTVITRGYMRGLPTVRRFESLETSNTTNPADDATKWQDIGPANTLAAFDNRISTRTTKTGNLVMTLTPGAVVTTVGLLNIAATAATVTVRDGATVSYTKTVDLVADNVTDWFEYFTATIERSSRAIFDNIPSYYSSTIEIELTGTAVGVGHIVFGQSFDLGSSPQYGASSGIIDYSIKEADEFGEEALLERSFADENSLTLQVDKSRINAVKRLLREIRATPCLWVGSSDPDYAEAFNVFGWYRSHQIIATLPTTAILDLELEGLS